MELGSIWRGHVESMWYLSTPDAFVKYNGKCGPVVRREEYFYSKYNLTIYLNYFK